MGNPRKNLIGLKFNRLTPIKYAGNSKWLCKCDCGNEIVVATKLLKNNNTKSCGCLNRENRSKLGKKYGKITGYKNRKFPNLPYDKTQKRLFRIWCHMQDRCINKYSHKNIYICEEWLHFPNFYNWAINNGYQNDLTIDRINNDGNYEPSNCRFATNKQQARNKSTNAFITYNNETHCIAEWEEITQLPVRCRLNKGWPIEKIMTTPRKNNIMPQ